MAAVIDIIKSQDIAEIKKLFKRPVFNYEQEKAINEYKVEKHDIFDATIRKPKVIKKGTGEIGSDGKEVTTTINVEPARIGMSFQQLIVDRRVGFMLTMPVKVEAVYSGEGENKKEKDLVKMVERIQNDNKMDYLNKEIAERLMSEMEVAEVWYFVETGEPKPKFALRCNIWSPDLGDTLYPLKDTYGNMIAFARSYKLKEGEKDIDHFDVYTADFEYHYVNRDSLWQLDVITDENGAVKPNPVPNLVKKIMIVYHSQKKPEWANQGSAINRLEVSKSNHADMNDYFGSPILAVEGEVRGFAQKGEQGKIMELMEGSRAAYLALEAPPESIKMEQESLKEDIYTLSQTPDISFSSMMKVGPVSGVALKMMFLDAHLAVSKKETIFGIGLQRRLNIIKAAIGAVIDVSLEKESKSVQLIPKITPYIPLNETELIDNISVSITSGQMSKETGIELNPLIQDPEAEVEKLKNDVTNELAEQ